MSFLPQNTILGPLEMVEVYEFYDRPILFVCKDATDKLYLVLLTDDSREWELWLYVAISQRRFQYIRSGGIDLRTAFKEAENGFVFQIRTYYKSDRIDIDQIPISDLDVDELPDEGEIINLPTHTLAKMEDNLIALAQQARREYIRISLESSDRKRTEIPAKILSEVFAHIQGIILALGHTITPVYKESKSPVRGLIQEMELSVLRVGAGSFEIEMASTTAVDMFSNSLIADALEQFILLINTEIEKDSLQEILIPYKTTVATQYYNLLQSLKTLDATNIRWASPKPGRGGSGILTSPHVIKAIDILKEWKESTSRRFTVTGVLLGLDTKGKTLFRIESGTEEYKGVFSKQITPDTFTFAANAKLGQRYQAHIQETVTTALATGIVTKKYELLDLQNLPGRNE